MKPKSPLHHPPPPRTDSYVAIAGHPLHPMLVNFPIAYLFGAFFCDLAFWWSGDAFWARAAIWVIGAGLVLGTLAGLAGTFDFLLVKKIRRHVNSWSHFLAAVMLLALTAANWWQRLPDPVGAVLPWGIFMSGLSAASLAFAGWLGGKLVFEQNVGIGEDTT